MSLVGDGLLVVRHRPVTGTSLPDYGHQFLPVKDPIFDKTVLLAVDDAVRKADPGAKIVLLGSDAALVEAQSKALDRDTTRDRNTGLLAPFAYCEVALVDLASGKVLAEESVSAAHAVSERLSDTLSPRDALKPEQKISFVRDLLREEIAQAVPAILPR